MKQYALVAFAFSPWIILLFVIILWLAGVFEASERSTAALVSPVQPSATISPIPTLALTATPTDTPIPPTSSPEPSPTVDPSEVGRALDGYRVLVGLKAVTGILSDAARQTERFNRAGSLVAAAFFLDTIETKLTEGAPVSALSASWPEAQAIEQAIKGVTGRWFKGEIDNNQALVELGPIDQRVDALLLGVDQDLGTAYNADPAELQSAREQVINELRAKLQATSTPQPETTLTSTPTSTPLPSSTPYLTPTVDSALNTNGQDRYNCSDFDTWAEANAAYRANQPGDPNQLDDDGDGDPCESLHETS